ncbi:hypothetical protein RhiirC2_501479 [Rhizophagus irregularis]|uniref:Uncharacterized protein n=1 Tax=Rhizophagus irregularis TaxID=588596 RepID=A0A2N1N6D7_9GLOM|nr:hypothetical protein RhiirC2_501479 [Rhizophagus irregularis]
MSFRKRTKTNKANAITIYTRVKEHPDVFRVENSLLFCNYCDLSVEWRHKSTVDSHCLGKKHLAQKKSMKLIKTRVTDLHKNVTCRSVQICTSKNFPVNI